MLVNLHPQHLLTGIRAVAAVAALEDADEVVGEVNILAGIMRERTKQTSTDATRNTKDTTMSWLLFPKKNKRCSGRRSVEICQIASDSLAPKRASQNTASRV